MQEALAVKGGKYIPARWGVADECIKGVWDRDYGGWGLNKGELVL